MESEGSLLLGNLKQKAAVIGAFARNPRYQGAGSSKLHPIKVENTWDAFIGMGLDVTYARGYDIKGSNNKCSDRTDIRQTETHCFAENFSDVKNTNKNALLQEETLIREACEAAKGKDIVYLFAGLPEGYESEGFDRTKLSLPEEHNRLIEAVCECNPKVVVILLGGAPMELPWIDKVKAVLLAYLGGEGGGRAVANLLLGFAVPCGKLAETWPIRIEDTPALNYFPGGRLTVEHRESIYVGYRYYEKAAKPVLFPFGHGLSYTDFLYSDLRSDCMECRYGDSVTIRFHVTNRGNVAAKETALIFVGHENQKVFLPKKQLTYFIKTEIQPGETKEITVHLDTGTFGYYNTTLKDWYAESGVYQIMLGTSSKECSLRLELKLISPEREQPDLRQVVPSYYLLPKGQFEVGEKEFEALYGKKLPISNIKAVRPYHSGNTLEDVSHTLVGKIIIWYANRVAKKVTSSETEQEGMIFAAMLEMPFHAMVTSGEGMTTESMMEGILDLLNGHYIRGIRKLLK